MLGVFQNEAKEPLFTFSSIRKSRVRQRARTTLKYSTLQVSCAYTRSMYFSGIGNVFPSARRVELGVRCDDDR